RRSVPGGQSRLAPRPGAGRHRAPLRRTTGRPRLGLLVGHARIDIAVFRRRASFPGGPRMNLARSFLASAALCLLAFAVPVAAAPAPADAQTGHHDAASGDVIYHIFVRSFADSDGDRIGDLEGITSRLDYIKQLGATAVLLTPLQPSPYYHNYFATAFKAVDPLYGSMRDYFTFVRKAHELGLKVYLDEEIQYVAEGHPWWK